MKHSNHGRDYAVDLPARTLDLAPGVSWHYGPPAPVKKARGCITPSQIWFASLAIFTIVASIVVPPIGITLLAIAALRYLAVRRGC